MVNFKNKELIDETYKRGIQAFTYGSLGAGILSGKFRTLPQFEPGDTRITFYDYFKEPKFSKIQELLKVMDKVAEKHHKTCAQIALNWNTSYAGVATSLCGITNCEYAKENCAAFDFEFDSEDLGLLNEAVEKLSQ